MVYALQKTSKLPTHKVVGMAGVLDSARMSLFLAQELNMSVKNIQTCVFGGHGDTMVPLIRYCSVAGVPLPEIIKANLISEQKVAEIIQRTRDGGAEIVKLLGTGSAFYAPASSAIAMAESYLFDKKQILPVAAYLTGEYKVNNLYIGVLAKIGKNGVEKIIELPLNQAEQQEFNKSVDAVKNLVAELKL
jgi:malate dehydrogenase